MKVDKNTSSSGTAFTISVDHEKTETGISAFERAETIQALIDEKSVAEDFKRPGHVFPLIAMDGGVFERKGHTEASVDLAKLCGVARSGVICEIINEDGTMSRLPQLQELAEKFDLKLIHIEDLIKYKQKNESLVKREVEAMLPIQN